jgi:hypothetical protein
MSLTTSRFAGCPLPGIGRRVDATNDAPMRFGERLDVIRHGPSPPSA